MKVRTFFSCMYPKIYVEHEQRSKMLIETGERGDRERVVEAV
jgi:hypothetical protein